ncbi:hypothetical protein GGI23_001271 [Coemansia sp. RSA 2559]|nr:hypothetical protein GGI23_001271 [Coemansia sp. RSA 2559]KAJ2869563.1 hypothetical protein GGI22_000171 [Coemansia erecta]
MSKKAAANSSAQQPAGSKSDRAQQGPKPKPQAVKPTAVPNSAPAADAAKTADPRLMSAPSSVSSSLAPSPSPSPKPFNRSGAAQAGKQRLNATGTATASDIIYKRIRTVRKKLQRAVASEQKAGASESRENTDALATASAKVATLRAIVKELEDLHKAVGGTGAVVDRRGLSSALISEDKVHQQTLRLVYAATRCAAPVDDAQRVALDAFFELVLADAKHEHAGRLVDEKLSALGDNTVATAKHLRRLAQRDKAAVDGLVGVPAAVAYEELARIIDQALAPSTRSQALGHATGADTRPLLREGMAQAAESQDVKIPKPTSIFVRNSGDGCDGGDSDGEGFNTTVVVPPGGLTFIASAELVDDSDPEDAADASVPQLKDSTRSEPIETRDSTRSEPIETKDSAIEAPAMALPVPDMLADASATRISGTERVGGFAPATGKLPAEAASGDAPQHSSIAGHSSAMDMPTPAHGPANITGSDAPPAGFMYGGGPPSWMPAATGPAGAAAATTGVPSMPGVYGMMPMHHYMPPLAAMQYGGYFPPHMYGMPEMSAVGSGSSDAGAQPSNSNNEGQSAAKDEQQQQQRQQQQQQQQQSSAAEVPPPSAATVARQQQLHQLQQQALASALPPGISMWQAGGGGAAAAASSNAPTPPPMMAAMPSSDSPSYQQAMGAAFSMNAPFMYPHVDATTLSTAATGGSDNNDSVNSLDSASNRGGSSSRPSSIHHYTQQQQQQLQLQQAQEAAARGLTQNMNVPEYVPATQYMWPQQPADPKQIQQQHGNYVYPQQQLQFHHGQAGSGSGYRGRDSGSTNSASTTSGNSNTSGGGGSGHYQNHHQYNYQRDRRNNNNSSGEYSRQRRWNNNNGGGGHQGYNRHHHNAHNSGVAQGGASASSAAASSYPNAAGSQNQHESVVGGYAAQQAGDAPPVAAPGSGNSAPAAAGAYYGNTFVGQQ